MPDHAMGHAILSALHADGADDSAVKSVPASSGRAGTCFIEYTSLPRSTQVIYDRAVSATSPLTTANVEWKVALFDCRS